MSSAGARCATQSRRAHVNAELQTLQATIAKLIGRCPPSGLSRAIVRIMARSSGSRPPLRDLFHMAASLSQKTCGSFSQSGADHPSNPVAFPTCCLAIRINAGTEVRTASQPAG